MSILQLNRIKRLLENQVVPNIDVEEIKSEKPKITEEELTNIILTRSYTLYALKSIYEWHIYRIKKIYN